VKTDSGKVVRHSLA